MTEAMSIEGMTAAYWELQNYWTKLRVPFLTDKSGTSDIDVLAFNPELGTLVIVECKAHGNKRGVFLHDEYIRNKFGDILTSDNKGNFKNLTHFNQIFKEVETIVPLSNLIKTVVYHHVSNLYLPTRNDREVAEKHVEDFLKPQLPPNYNIKVQINSTLDIVCDLLTMERNSNRSKRFGNPFLDLIREINRYVEPTFELRGSKMNLNLTKDLKEKLQRALNLD